MRTIKQFIPYICINNLKSNTNQALLKRRNAFSIKPVV
jgi:hypothetical protein